MRELKIYKALLHLSANELNKFRKYVISPFFNVNQRVITIYEFYSEEIKKESTPDMVIESYVWKNTFAPIPPDYKLLRRLNSDLLNHLIGFFAQKEFVVDKLLYNNLKIKGIGKKKIQFLFDAVEKTNQRNLDLFPNKSSDYYFSNYTFEKIKTEMKSDDDRKKSKAKVQDEISIDKVSYNLDQFYIIEKLKLYITLLSWKKSYKIEQKISHIHEIKSILSKETEKNEIISVYLTIVKTLEKPKVITYFHLLRSQAKKYKYKFSEEDYNYIYDALISYSITTMNKGNSDFIRISLDVYKEALKTKALLKNGKIPEITFNNIVAMACRNKELSWASQFIEDYSSYLDANSGKSAVSIASARVEFYRKNFKKVVELLSEVEYETVIYNLNSKTILLYSYYEMKEFDALDSLINAFKVYLNRERSISKGRKKRYNQLLGFVKRIANVNPRDKRKIKLLKKRLDETDGVLNKTWLLEKVAELEDGLPKF